MALSTLTCLTLAAPAWASASPRGLCGTPCTMGLWSAGVSKAGCCARPGEQQFEGTQPCGQRLCEVSLSWGHLHSFPHVALCGLLTLVPLQDVLRAGDNAVWTHLLQGVPRTLPGPPAQLSPLQTEPERGEGMCPTGWSPGDSWVLLSACPELGWEGAML